jgi:hypothetical protein
MTGADGCDQYSCVLFVVAGLAGWDCFAWLGACVLVWAVWGLGGWVWLLLGCSGKFVACETHNLPGK